MRASASARLPFITLKKPNMARAVKGTATTNPVLALWLSVVWAAGTHTGTKSAARVRATTAGAARPPKRPTAATTMNTHMTEASARANGTSATHRATIMARSTQYWRDEGCDTAPSARR